jgi:hypothetical protein
MAFTTAGRNALLASGKGGVTYVGALTDVNNTEVAGGSYARQAVTFGTPASGLASNTGALVVPIPAGTTVQSIGLYDAVTAGNLLGVFGYGSAGQLVKGLGTVDAATDLFLSKAHGVTTDDRVFFSPVNGEAIPTGISTTTLYFVLASSLTTDVFKVATTSGGTALDVTVSGEFMFQKTVPNTFASAGNANLAIGAVVLDLTEA